MISLSAGNPIKNKFDTSHICITLTVDYSNYPLPPVFSFPQKL